MKPTVFVSSAIYDFEDIRGALKYCLEESGFRVQLSEAPAFERDADSNSYEACLDAIRKSDVFILLIGNRRGGWYDKQKRISITQREYQVAYEESKRRSLLILPFVRKQTWDLNFYHKELKAKLSRVIGAKSRIKQENELLQDPEHLEAFLKEVGRVKEMKEAAEGDGRPLPKGNWITLFSNFREIIENIEIVLKLSTDVSTRHLLHLASSELQRIVAKFVEFADTRPVLITSALEKELPVFKVSPGELIGEKKKVRLTRRQISVFATFAMQTWSRTPFSCPGLEKLYLSDALAKFNPSRNKFEPNELQEAVERTFQAISLFADRDTLKKTQETCSRFIDEGKGSKDYETFPFPAFTAVMMAAYFIQARTVVNEAMNLICHIELRMPLQSDPTKGVSLARSLEPGRASELARSGKFRTRELFQMSSQVFDPPTDAGT